MIRSNGGTYAYHEEQFVRRKIECVWMYQQQNAGIRQQNVPDWEELLYEATNGQLG